LRPATLPLLDGDALYREAYRVSAEFGQQLIRDMDDLKTAFKDILLRGLLDVTGSQYGFICEALEDPDGTPYIRTFGHALTDISWSEETQALYAAHVAQGMEFRNLNTLFGQVVATHEPVIANSPSTDPRRGGIPHGHPPLDAFLGLPLLVEGTLIGEVGIANRPGGYSESIVEAIAPILLVAGTAITALRARAAAAEAEELRLRSLRGIAAQNEELRHLNAMKDTFVASVSHELRTPLTAILTFADDLSAATDTETALAGEVIHRNAKRLLSLTDDILLMTSRGYQTFEVTRERQDVRALVERIVADIRQDSSAHFTFTAFHPDLDPYFEVDADRVLQAVSNIVKNAIKFAKTADGVRVESILEADGWHVRVTDDGIGIPADEVERVRNPFYRASNADAHSVRGSGIGLHVVDLIMHGHGGSMAIDSTEGAGTVVTLTFPRG